MLQRNNYFRNEEELGFSFQSIVDMGKNFGTELKETAQRIIANQKATDAAKTAASEAQKEVQKMKQRNQLILLGAVGVGVIYLLKK